MGQVYAKLQNHFDLDISCVFRRFEGICLEIGIDEAAIRGVSFYFK